MSERIPGNLRFDLDRLLGRIDVLGRVGALDGGGVCRLALSDADREGRDLVVGWMESLGPRVTVDRIGNVIGVHGGLDDGAPVATGSHIDAVATGGLYDGCLGVLAGLEVVATLNDAGIRTRRPIAVGFFTNEGGARFSPDMMGSGAHQGALDLDEMLATQSVDGRTVGQELQRIGYDGDEPVGIFRAHRFFELHVEQGPVLEQDGVTIGAVTGVQGISWTKYLNRGVSNHAGTTPMHLRHDAGYASSAIAVEARRIAAEAGGNQVATFGVVELDLGLVNGIARGAPITVDFRNTNNGGVRAAEARLAAFVEELACEEGVVVESRSLARFNPVEFDPGMVSLVDDSARALGHTSRRLPSGAGHDARMFAPNCPTSMIFVPSRNGISHNIEEFTAPKHLRAGADTLLQAMLASAGGNSA